jgi:ATP-dependent DNA ligase
VRLFICRSYDWTSRYLAIASPAKFRARSFTLDGEAVACGPDGVTRQPRQHVDLVHERGNDRLERSSWQYSDDMVDCADWRLRWRRQE